MRTNNDNNNNGKDNFTIHSKQLYYTLLTFSPRYNKSGT